jgi:hypothetical protein
MLFKTPEVEEEFEHLTVLLQDIAVHLDLFCTKSGFKEITVTRVLEHVCGDSGVHEAKRAFDVRNEFDGQRTYTDEQMTSIVDYLNRMYPRNDGFPTALHHSFHGGPFHLHVQIALNVMTYVPNLPEKTPETAGDKA